MTPATGDTTKGFAWRCPRCLVTYVVEYHTRGEPKCPSCSRKGKRR